MKKFKLLIVKLLTRVILLGSGMNLTFWEDVRREYFKNYDNNGYPMCFSCKMFEDKYNNTISEYRIKIAAQLFINHILFAEDISVNFYSGGILFLDNHALFNKIAIRKMFLNHMVDCFYL